MRKRKMATSSVKPFVPAINYILFFTGKNVWVSCSVVNVREDALLSEDMVWRVDTGNGEAGDAHPEPMTDDERSLRFDLCFVLILGAILY